jgi:hypothetical protein
VPGRSARGHYCHGGDTSRRPGSSPVAGASGTACTVESRDAEEIIGFFFDAAGTPQAAPAATTVDSEAELPQGEPVDPAVEEAVNATVSELITCFEAGQYACVFA